MTSLRVAACLAAALMLGAAAPGADGQSTSGSMSNMPGMSNAAATSHLTARSNMSAPGPNAVDIGFSQDMAVHHDQAVLMARMVRDRASPRVRQLASQIEANQVQEIGMMRGWLLLWNQPPLATAPMAWMMSPGQGGHDAMADGPMPGLASQPELEALQKAQGPDIDRLFLRMMIKHHLGGIIMLHAVEKGAALPAVRTMARNMEFDETQEIVYMGELAQGLGMPVKQVPLQ